MTTVAIREQLYKQIDDFSREVELVRQQKELMRFLAQRSREGKTYTLTERGKREIELAANVADGAVQPACLAALLQPSAWRLIRRPVGRGT